MRKLHSCCILCIPYSCVYVAYYIFGSVLVLICNQTLSIGDFGIEELVFYVLKTSFGLFVFMEPSCRIYLEI